MPLLPGRDPSIISSNISELRQSGRPEAQSVAIAYDHSRKTGTAKPKPKVKRKAPYAAKNLGAFHHKPKAAKKPATPTKVAAPAMPSKTLF